MIASLTLTEIVDRLDPDTLFPLLVVALGCLTGIVITTVIAVASTFDAMHRRRTDERLKRDMLDLGMGADEVARVVEARSPGSDDDAA